MMDTERWLVLSGVGLLAVAALSGFVQHAYREDARRFAEWRVVHAGGTAGAVQLIALAAVWHRVGSGGWPALIAVGIVLATFAFFAGPMANALGFRRTSRALLGMGGLVALPAYFALPLAFLVSAQGRP